MQVQKDNDNTQRIPGIDTFRLCAVFSIIFLHVEYGQLPESLVWNLRLLCRWAVPFFFITGGYFSESKGKDYYVIIKKLLIIFFISSLIYLPVSLIKYGPGYIFSFDVIWLGTYFHLWFISSMVFGYLVIGLMERLRSSLLLPYISIFCLLYSLASDPYNVFKLSFPLGGMYCLSIPFLWIGMMIARSRKSLNAEYCLLLITAGLLLQIIEAMKLESFMGINPYDQQFLAGSIPLSIGMFMLSLRKIRIPSDLIMKMGRKYPLGVYLYHPLVSMIVFSIIAKILFGDVIANSNIYYLLRPIAVGIICLLGMAMLEKYYPMVYQWSMGDI
jgi:surface polysaccharide O-acyltransferase-like enzyme